MAIPSVLETGKSMLTDAMSSFWGSGTDTGKIKSPYKTAPEFGGAGTDAKLFVQGLMQDALYVRYKRQRGRNATDIHGRSLASMVIGTARGEIDVEAELIRSGFSTYVQSFGTGPEAQKYMAAQVEASAAKRGPMWGGGGPAPVQYQAPTIDNALDITGNLSPEAVTVIDADTFSVGLQGEIRLTSVNTPEITAKGAYGDRPFLNGKQFQREQRLSWQMSGANRKPRWYAIRKETVTNPGQFEAIKPHPGYGFPGGREQPFDDPRFANVTPSPGVKGPHDLHVWYIDTETQGIRTGSYTKTGQFVGRGPGEPIGISQFAAIKVRPDGSTETQNVFTDLVDQSFLGRHGVTKGHLEANRPLPQSALDELVREHSTHGSPTRPRWDPSVGVQGSVLDMVYRRHARHVLDGGAVTPQVDLYRKMADEWQSIADKGGKLEIRAWNVSYDFTEIVREMRRHGLGDRVDNLLKTNTIRAREMMESVHAMQFEHMLRSNWAPVITDRATVQAALGQNLKNITLADAKRLGMIREHTGLRNLMDDIATNSASAFQRRAERWIESQGMSAPEARKVVAGIAEEMGQITDWHTFKSFVAGAHRSQMDAPIYGTMSKYDIVGAMYREQGAGHVHVLGSLSSGTRDAVGEHLGATAFAGEYSGFSMILGNRLEDVGSHLVDHQKELRVADDRAKSIQAAVGQHEAALDTRTALDTVEEVERIRKDTALSKIWNEGRAAAHEEQSVLRLNQLYQDMLQKRGPVIQHDAAQQALRGGGPALGETAMNKAGKGGPNWATWALGAAALWIISENNRVDRTPVQIEGERRSESWYNSISGINPSELPFSNISNFHSGYDTFGVMAQTAPRGAPASPARVSQIAAVEGSRNYYQQDYSLPPGLTGGGALPPLPPDAPISGMDHWAMSDMRGAGFQQASAWARPPMVPRMRMADAQNADAFMYAGAPSPARSYLLETFNAMGSGEDVDIGGEVARIPLGYSGAATGRFRSGGHAGYVQRLGEDAMGSRIRDHATQLRRLPGMPVTTQGRDATSMNSHAEAQAFSESMGDLG